MSKNKKIKARRKWTRSPIEQVIPNKKKTKDDKFNDSLLRGQKIKEEDLDELDDFFERGIK